MTFIYSTHFKYFLRHNHTASAVAPCPGISPGSMVFKLLRLICRNYSLYFATKFSIRFRLNFRVIPAGIEPTTSVLKNHFTAARATNSRAMGRYFLPFIQPCCKYTSRFSFFIFLFSFSFVIQQVPNDEFFSPVR